MFQYHQHRGNKKLAVIFTVLFCIVGGLIIVFGMKMFVTLICILIAIVGYIAIIKFRLFGTSLTGENLHKREPIDLVNLNINVIEDSREMVQKNLRNIKNDARD